MSNSETTCHPPDEPEAGSTVPVTPATAAAAPSRPWGFWATMGWSAILTLIWLIAGSLAVAAFLVAALAQDPNLDIVTYVHGLESNGLVLSLSTLPAYGLGLFLLILFVRIRRWKVRDYVSLKPLKAKETLVAVALFAAFIAAQDTVTVLSGRQIVPKFMTEVWGTAGALPLLLLTLLVAAPVFEEIWFRGFVFRGVAASRLGGVGAVLLTSLLWSLLHVQYDWFGVAAIFVGGIFLGVVRLKTGSTTLVVLLHAILNLVASVECALVTAGVVPPM